MWPLVPQQGGCMIVSRSFPRKSTHSPVATCMRLIHNTDHCRQATRALASNPQRLPVVFDWTMQTLIVESTRVHGILHHDLSLLHHEGGNTGRLKSDCLRQIRTQLLSKRFPRERKGSIGSQQSLPDTTLGIHLEVTFFYGFNLARHQVS